MANSKESLEEIIEKAGSFQMELREDLEEENLNVDDNEYSKSQAASFSAFKPYQPKLDEKNSNGMVCKKAFEYYKTKRVELEKDIEDEIKSKKVIKFF